jgi:hypothetical protein
MLRYTAAATSARLLRVLLLELACSSCAAVAPAKPHASKANFIILFVDGAPVRVHFWPRVDAGPR